MSEHVIPSISRQILTYHSFEDEWDPVDLSQNQCPALPSEVFIDDLIVPEIIPFQKKLSENRASSLHIPHKFAKVKLPGEYRSDLQNVKPTAHVGACGRFANTPEPEIQEDASIRVLKSSAYSKYREQQSKPDATYEIAHTFEYFCKALADRGQRNVRKGPQTDNTAKAAKDKIENISISADVFIQTPSPDSNQFKIWGSIDAVEKAKSMLQAWELYTTRSAKIAKNAIFTKQRAYDGREQHRHMLATIKDLDEAYFQQSADHNSYLLHAYLIWPEGYDFEQYISDYDKGALERIRRGFRCIIRHEKSPIRLTKVEAESEGDLLSVYDRLIYLSKEMIARETKGIKSNQCRYPSHVAFRENVICQKIGGGLSRAHQSGVVLPQLKGAKLSPDEIGRWAQLANEFHRQCLSTTKSALRSSLAALHVSEKHVRMKISFGDLGLLKYKKPKKGQDYYSLSEFITMIQHRDIELHQIPLLTSSTDENHKALLDFVDRLDKMKQFGRPELNWTVSFDFQNQISANILRLETQFQQSPIDVDAPERSAIRWLNFSADTAQEVENILEVNVMDFERVGWRLHIGSVSLLNSDRVAKDLRCFEDNIRFKPATNGLRSLPRKQTIFPPGQRDLLSMREITSAQYQFKDTGGVFEIQRVDVYQEGRSVVASTPSRTEWHANYFYPGWDNLLSMMANIRDGEDVEWPRNLSTFFPHTKEADDYSSLPNGYKTFMEEVEEIQDLLTIALNRDDHCEHEEA